MDTIGNSFSGWLHAGLWEEGEMETACLEGGMLVARLSGRDFRLPGGWPGHWHVFMQVYEGELRLTADGDRMGFEAPVYVDFIQNFAWADVRLAGRCRASVVVVEEDFFAEAVRLMRGKVADGLMGLAQSPFALLEEEEAGRLQAMEDALFAVLRERDGAFAREPVQALTCAWQYEVWNVFFRRRRRSPAGDEVRWKDVAAHFLYLAHAHCRERHAVGWYARQIGVSADALSAALRRLYGKSASAILMGLLLVEAKVCLRDARLSLQEVAEMLGFADQSAFGKFFKRQCGLSPSAFRNRRDAD